MHPAITPLVAIAATSAASHAATGPFTIAEQPFNPDVGAFQPSEAMPGGLFDTRAADNFTVDAPVTITHASWIGAEEGFFSVGFPGNLAGFLVEFFDDNAGTPGASLASQTFDIADITATDTGFDLFNDPAEGDIYEFTAELATPLTVAPGQYWFSAGAMGVNNFFDDDTFFWGFSADGDDQYALQTPANSGFPFFIPNAFTDPDNADLAFTLTGIPAPAAASLLAPACLAAARRRR
jgi:hypothetical protein